MRTLQVFRSSRGVIDMGVGMFLAAASFHFISALVMNVLMPLLAMPFPGLEAAEMNMVKQHPMVMSVNWGNFLQALLELLLCVIVSVLILRWAERADNRQPVQAEK